MALPFFLACLAAAQDQVPGEPAAAGPARERVFRVEHGWHEFEKGAWVELKVTRREGGNQTERAERRTLRGIEKDGTAMVAVTDPAKPADTVLLSVEDLCIPEEELKCEFFGSQENGGVQRVQLPFLTTSGSATAKRNGTVYRFTLSSSIPTPGSVLNSDILYADGATIERHVTFFDQFVEFGGRRVMGTAYREHETLAGKSMETGVHGIESPDVPGGVVSRKIGGHILRDGAKTAFEVEETVTAFGDDPADLDVKTRRACDDVRTLFRYVASPWKGFGEGSSVVMRYEDRSAEGTFFQVDKTTVKAVKTGGWTMTYEVRESWHRANEEGRSCKPSEQDVPWNASSVRRLRVKHLGTETLTACGKEWPCELFAVELPAQFSWGVLRTDKVVQYRVWRCAGFPANDGVVRREYGWGVRGKEAVMTETQTVIDLDRKYAIGGTEYSCAVIRTVHEDDSADALTESERWVCPGVPGGQLRQENWTTRSGKRELTGRFEAIEVDIRKP